MEYHISTGETKTILVENKSTVFSKCQKLFISRLIGDDKFRYVELEGNSHTDIPAGLYEIKTISRCSGCDFHIEEDQPVSIEIKPIQERNVLSSESIHVDGITTLIPPENANHAEVSVWCEYGEFVSWTVDGSTPTTDGVGYRTGDGKTFELESLAEVQNFKAINQSNASIYITYFELITHIE